MTTKLPEDERKRRHAARRDRWREANKDKYKAGLARESARLKAAREFDPEYKQKINEQTRAHYHKVKHEQPERFLLQSAKRRAKAAGIPCTITAKDIFIPEVCPVFGWPLKKNEGKLADTSPSLDRIDPSLGYVPGNVQVISNKANVMKNNASREQLIKFAEWVLK